MAFNNPFNIRYSASNVWQGQIKPLNGFCQFDTFENGVRAYWLLIKTYVCKYRLRSVRAIISRYAPVTENPLENYIKFCTDRVFDDGIFCNDTEKLVLSQYFILALAMFHFETGHPANGNEFMVIRRLFVDFFKPSYERVYG